MNSYDASGQYGSHAPTTEIQNPDVLNNVYYLSLSNPDALTGLSSDHVNSLSSFGLPESITQYFPDQPEDSLNVSEESQGSGWGNAASDDVISEIGTGGDAPTDSGDPFQSDDQNVSSAGAENVSTTGQNQSSQDTVIDSAVAAIDANVATSLNEEANTSEVTSDQTKDENEQQYNHDNSII